MVVGSGVTSTHLSPPAGALNHCNGSRPKLRCGRRSPESAPSMSLQPIRRIDSRNATRSWTEIPEVDRGPAIANRMLDGASPRWRVLRGCRRHCRCFWGSWPQVTLGAMAVYCVHGTRVSWATFLTYVELSAPGPTWTGRAHDCGSPAAAGFGLGSSVRTASHFRAGWKQWRSPSVTASRPRPGSRSTLPVLPSFSEPLVWLSLVGRDSRPGCRTYDPLARGPSRLPPSSKSTSDPPAYNGRKGVTHVGSVAEPLGPAEKVRTFPQSPGDEGRQWRRHLYRQGENLRSRAGSYFLKASLPSSIAPQNSSNRSPMSTSSRLTPRSMRCSWKAAAGQGRAAAVQLWSEDGQARSLLAAISAKLQQKSSHPDNLGEGVKLYGHSTSVSAAPCRRCVQRILQFRTYARHRRGRSSSALVSPLPIAHDPPMHRPVQLPGQSCGLSQTDSIVPPGDGGERKGRLLKEMESEMKRTRRRDAFSKRRGEFATT